HVYWWRRENDREKDQEEIRPTQRPGAVAADTAAPLVPRSAVPRDRRNRDGRHASFPRRLMSRRMKIAAMVRIGSMNNETLAPSGMSPLSMPTRNAQVAKMCVWS